MENFNLNVGGIVGAIVGVGAAVGIIFALSSAEAAEDGSTTIRYGLAFPLLFGGAYAGNFLWAKFVSKPKPEEPGEPGAPDDQSKA